ncbi:MAG: nuclear transport factor 2 family protein [Alphaproteobacteria bacterium]|nr:nuclear transport factor 2 family protein [Alphaproteobacteria bacterium]
MAKPPAVTLDRLREIGGAFARHDVEGIVEAFADDGEFRNARGPDVWGKSYRGKAEIRAFFTALFAASPDVQWRHTAEFVAGDRAVTEWHRTATLADGTRQAWLGCDLYTFRGGKILLKDTYIKVVG